MDDMKIDFSTKETNHYIDLDIEKELKEAQEECKKQKELQSKKEEIMYAHNAECPYCHSKNTKKISGISKAGSVAMFGIFAIGKVSKQWHCNNCKSDF